MLIFLFIGSIIVCTYIYKIYNCFDHDKDIDFQEIPNFLSKDECNELITYFEQHKENHSKYGRQWIFKRYRLFIS